MELILMKLQEHKGYFHLQIPKTLVGSIGWAKGQELNFELTGKKEELLIKTKN